MSIFELETLARSNRSDVDDFASLPPPSGKPIPYAEIYRRYFREVGRSVRRFGVAERHADDVTQDVFLAVHRALPRFDWSRRFTPWLKTIAYRIARDHRRAGKNTEQLTISDGFDPPDTASEDREGRLAGARDALKEMDAILQSLDDEDREVLLLCEIDECRVMDVARALGLPDSTVSTRLQRARKRFDAARARRRIAEERRLGVAFGLPVVLLDPATLWRAARTLPEVSSAAQARIWSRLVRATATHRAVGSLAALSALTPAQILGGALLAASLGAAVGGAAVHALSCRSNPGAIVAFHEERSAVAAPEVQSSGSAATAALPPAMASAATMSARDQDAGAAPRPMDDRAASERAEMVLIDSARNSLRSNHPEDALASLARHAHRFPGGVYQEERESLRQEARRRLHAEEGGRP